MINYILNEVGTAIQSKFRFIPILIDDLAVEKRIGKFLNAKEIKLLIPEVYLDKNWKYLKSLMLSRSFELSNTADHAFYRNGITVSFALIDDFVNLTGISTKKLPRENTLFTYFLPNAEQLITYFTALEKSEPGNTVDIQYRIDLLKSELKAQTIVNTKKIIKNICDTVHLPHDYTHYIRVSISCRKLSQEFSANEYICVMAALLYDIDTISSAKSSKYKIEKLLKNEAVSEGEINYITSVIKEVKSKERCRSKDAKCLSDAVNLDYCGAVGLAEIFAEYGAKRLPMYPLDDIPINASEDEFHKCRDALENITLIKQRCKKTFYSDYAKNIAKDRLEFMQSFLYRFYDECEGYL